MAKGTKRKKEPRMIDGTSDYVVRENAARKQLGVAGLAARNKQLPAAVRATARGLVREITGVDISRKGISVDPASLAMALPVGKVLKAARVLRAAGQVGKANALTTRVIAKAVGGSRAAARGMREQKVVPYMTPEWPGVSSRTTATKARGLSESVFPRITKSNVSEGTLNIVDTRRMNPAQAKSALEGGVSQVAKFARRTPAKEKPVKGVTGRLLRGRER